MQRGDPLLGYRRPVLRRRVADVRVEVPLRVALGGAAHVAVAGDLCQHGGRRDRGTARVAADHRAVLEAKPRDAKAVDKAQRLVARHAVERRAQRLKVRHVEPARVDAARAARHDRGPRRGPQDERVELLPARLGVLLGVVQVGERAPVRQRQAVEVEQDRGRDERPGERTPAGLVGPCDEAPLEGAVEGEQLAAAAWPRARSRAFRLGRAASR